MFENKLFFPIELTCKTFLLFLLKGRNRIFVQSRKLNFDYTSNVDCLLCYLNLSHLLVSFIATPITRKTVIKVASMISILRFFVCVLTIFVRMINCSFFFCSSSYRQQQKKPTTALTQAIFVQQMMFNVN